jgi:hypothetical protein
MVSSVSPQGMASEVAWLVSHLCVLVLVGAIRLRRLPQDLAADAAARAAAPVEGRPQERRGAGAATPPPTVCVRFILTEIGLAGVTGLGPRKSSGNHAGACGGRGRSRWDRRPPRRRRRCPAGTGMQGQGHHQPRARRGRAALAAAAAPGAGGSARRQPGRAAPASRGGVCR